MTMEKSSSQSQLSLNDIFNQFFDEFGDDLMFLNNMREVRKICPTFKRVKNKPEVKEKNYVERS